MKTFAAAIFEAEKHTKQAPKFEALAGLTGDELKLAVEALNPYRVFNIRKYDLPKAYAAADASYVPFFGLLDELHERTLTGNAAKAAVTAALAEYTELTAKALMRVLDKDLKCGATVSTFKKIYPGFDVPEFDLMGAEKMDPKYVWQFPCLCESKYDGQRAIAMVRFGTSGEGNVSYLSRSGKSLPHLEGLFDNDLISLAKLIGTDIIVDGEALAGSFQESIKAKGSNNDSAKANLKFYAFDWMLLTEWEVQDCPVTQKVRSETLEAYLKQLGSTVLVKSKYKIVQNLAEAHEFYTEVLKEGLNADGTTNGLGEGLIVKYLGAFYKWNLGGSRGPEWTKWKPIIDVDLKITGFYEGNAGTKNEGKLGGMTLEGTDENRNVIKTDCGGFKVSHPKMKPLLAKLAAIMGVQFENEKKPNFVKNKDQFLRQYIWDHQDEFLGQTAMLEAQEMCLAENSTVYALRFPQFVTIRDDK